MLIELANSEADWDTAIALATGIFAPMAEAENYPETKRRLWRDDPSFALDNLILARDASGQIAGLVRLVPRTIYRGSHPLSAVGMTSICMAHEFRGQGHSVPLMDHAIGIVIERGYDFAFLIARRAVDNYYTRFGFWGASSYGKVRISASDMEPVSCGISLDDSSLADLEVYDEAYCLSYGEVFGRVERDRPLWRFILKKAQDEGFVVKTVRCDGAPIGYVVLVNGDVLELALTSADYAKPVLSRLMVLGESPELTCHLPAGHTLLHQLSGWEVLVSFRECPWGGHMVRVLDGQPDIGGCPSYEETLERLGIRVASDLSSQAHADRLQFNIGRLDEI